MNIYKNNLIINVVFLAAVFYILVPAKTFAALGTFTSDISEANIGDQVQVDFFMDTEDQEINAVEGKVSFPSALFEFEEVREGNSLVNFWVDKPALIEPCSSLCGVSFSGIIPGGYNSKRGLLFSFVLKAIAEGEGRIGAQSLRALLNDGQGTEIPLTAGELTLRVSTNTSGINRRVALAQDSDKPEFFDPLVSQDPNIFDGKYFLVFATQDKGSGIEGYFVYESREYKIDSSEGSFVPHKARWVTAQSPYLLEDQELHSYIFVKVTDKAGNERIVMLPPESPSDRYGFPKTQGTIVIGTIVSVLILFLLNKKAFHKSLK